MHKTAALNSALHTDSVTVFCVALLRMAVIPSRCTKYPDMLQRVCMSFASKRSFMQQSLCVQDMLYRKNLLEAMGLEVALPLILEVDNKGLVDIVNSFRVGGRTHHIDIKQFFLHVLQESKQLIFMWIPGSTNNVNTNMFQNFGWTAIQGIRRNVAR
jgi:hypothetical protein